MSCPPLTITARLAVSLSLFIILGVLSAHAAPAVGFVGQDTSTGASWYDATVPKSDVHDLDGDDQYGTSGYHVLVTDGTVGGNGAVQIRSSAVAGITVTPLQNQATNSYSENSGQLELINDPNTGPPPTNIRAGYWYNAADADFFQLDFTADVNVAIAVLHNVTNYNENPAWIRLRQSVGGTADTGTCGVANGAGSQAFYSVFHVSGTSGDRFVISAGGGGGGNQSLGGLLFDVANAPSLMMLGQDTSAAASWFDATVGKDNHLDVEDDDQYGTAGYHVLVTDGTVGGNGAVLTRSSAVTGITVTPLLTPATNSYSENSGQLELINDPDTGPPPTNIRAGYWYNNGTANFFQIDFTADATVSIGVLHNVSNYNENPAAIGIQQTLGGALDTGLVGVVNNTAAPAYATFFYLAGTTGDRFVVSAGNGPGANQFTVSGLTFDNIAGVSGPEIDVQGNGTSITNGDATPDAGDDTDFGSADTGTTVTKVYTINNTGSADLTIAAAGITISAGSSDFSINTTPALPLVIAAAGSATFSVDFDPSSVAAGITATVSIASDDPDENPFTFNVEGEGTAPPVPEINVQGNSVNIADGDTSPDVADDTEYGNTGVAQPKVRTFTIQNLGAVGLNVASVASNDAEFVVGGTTSGVISAAGSFSFTVTYTPAAAAANTATITINSNDADEAVYTFDVGGTGVPAVPEINVTGNAVDIVSGDNSPAVGDDTDFGSVTSGSNPTATFTIENNGYNTLNVTGVTRSAGSTDYNITAGAGAAAIPIGGTSTFTVTYSGATIGATAATISIANDDSDENPYTFDVGGTGQPAGPLVSASGNGVTILDGDVTPDLGDHTNFGSVPVTISLARTYTITNTGDTTLNVSGITVGGVSAAKFGVSGISFPAAIAVGATDTFLVTYIPTSATTDTASISIASDDLTSPYAYSIGGSGVNVFNAASGGGGNGPDNAVGDAFLITQGGGNLVISVNGVVTATVPDTQPIVINGSSDDDTLTVDLGGGPMPDITYNGTGGFDTLVLVNADGTLMTYTPSTTTDGTIDIDGNVLTFTGLAPITQTGTLADVVIDTTAPGAQTIDIDATATDTTIDANGGFELITFTNATNSLSVNAGNGNDIIRINTFAAATPTINVDGQDGDDTISMPYSVATAGHTFNIAGSSHTAGDLLNFDPEGNGITVNATTITGTPATINYATIETVNTVGEIDVLGNSNSITDGDVTPSVADHSDFGNAVVGLTTVTRTFTITNTGAATINVAVPVTISGANSAQFSVSIQPAAVVAPGASTTFDVLFTPASTATYTATVNITNDDADEGAYDFAIQGIGDPAPSTIPTMGEWGMVILCLLMGSFGLVYMRRESLATAGGAAPLSGSPALPLDRALLKRCLLVFAGITVVGFAASAAVIGYVQLSDAVGGPICAAVAAYFTHLVILMKREE